jgi:RNA polymerase sigma factor (sigma-70 family)
MQTLTDEVLVEQLKAEHSASFQLLYKFYYPSVASFVRQNMGNTEDAEDIFQETIVVLLRKVRQPEFALTSSLKTYLYAIAKNLWLKRLRSNKLISVEDFEKYLVENTSFSIELKPELSKEEKVDRWIKRITDNCQRILKAIFFNHEKMETLMKKMGWRNKHVAANQQYKCIQQIKKEKDKEKEN